MNDLLSQLQVVLQQDPSFLEFSSSVKMFHKPKRMFTPGDDIKTLRELQSGSFSLRKGSVGRVIGVSKNPIAYVASFEGAVVYIDPSLVAKATGGKDTTNVVFNATSSNLFKIGEQVRVRNGWGYFLSSLNEGSKSVVISNSAGGFGPFLPMLVVKANSGTHYMVPEKYFEVSKDTKIHISSSDDDYLNLGDHLDTGTLSERSVFESEPGNDTTLEDPKPVPVVEDQNRMLQLIHELEEKISPERFREWLDQNKVKLSEKAQRFADDLIRLWGYKLGVVFSYPVSSGLVCRNRSSLPFIYKSKMCDTCVSKRQTTCMKHSAQLLTDKQIQVYSDAQFLRMLSKGPIELINIYSSLQEYAKNEILKLPVKVSKKAGIEIDFDPDIF